MTVDHSAEPPRRLDTPEAVLAVRDLEITLQASRDDQADVRAVYDVSFDINRHEVLGIVGESGSGKTLTALAIAGMLPTVAKATGGTAWFDDLDLLNTPEPVIRRIRGRRIGLVFQDPLAYLHPLKTIGNQLRETLTLHGVSSTQARRRAQELLGIVGVVDAAKRIDDYPHQFSGGMRQRVMIAMAVAHDPALLIADEPTTALDVTVQAEILRLIGRLREELGTAVLLITHDMGVVEDTCDRILVMYSGRVAEQGGIDAVVGRPSHPYTRELLRTVPRIDVPVTRRLPTIPGQPPDPAHRPAGCSFHDRCPEVLPRCEASSPPRVEVDAGHSTLCWLGGEAGRNQDPTDAALLGRPGQAPNSHREPAAAGGNDEVVVEVVGVRVRFGHRRWPRGEKGVEAVRGVDLELSRGRTVALVGESGSGKSTLARAVVGLQPITAGLVRVDGLDWSTADRADRKRMRRSVQMVFQDPYAAMNPRMTIREMVAEPIRNFDLLRESDVVERVNELLGQVGLSAAFAERYPYQLSGGQRQRIGIARALAVEPKIIVADEPVSALDVSVQAQVINLFADLREQLDVGYLFITHDLAVARQVADDVVIMYRGEIVERGPVDQVMTRPNHDYTASLLASVPGRNATRFDDPAERGRR